MVKLVREVLQHFSMVNVSHTLPSQATFSSSTSLRELLRQVSQTN
jgi:hypothetical protein